jgi:hypothetical protein
VDSDNIFTWFGIIFVSILVGLGIVWLLFTYVFPINPKPIDPASTGTSIPYSAKPVVEKPIMAAPQMIATTYSYKRERLGQWLSGMSGSISGVEVWYPVRPYFQVIHKNGKEEDFMALIPATLAGQEFESMEFFDFEQYNIGPEVKGNGLIVPLLKDDRMIEGKTFFRTVIIGLDGVQRAVGAWEYLGIMKTKNTR